MTISGEPGLSGALPIRFPIFPLPGAILLPGGNLPLNIFEPRYLQMTRDAMRTDQVIGMIQPTDSASPGGPAIYPIGCVGRITSFAETDDGRYLITLTGVCRFEVVEELAVDTPYRQVVASFERWQCDLEPPTPSDSLRPPLVGALRGYFEVYEISADWRQVQSAPLAGLVTSLAMICPFEPCEKQALLEAADPEQRAKVLIALLQMGACGAKGCGAGPRH
jgi:Lon protease-like protein